MAVEAKITLRVEVSGLGSQDIDLSHSFTHNATPAEIFHGYAVIGANTVNLDLGNITDTDLLGVLFIAKGTADTDYVGILVNDVGTGTPATDAGNITLNAGEAVYLNFGGSTKGLTSAYEIRLTGLAATTSIEYIAFGK